MRNWRHEAMRLILAAVLSSAVLGAGCDTGTNPQDAQLSSTTGSGANLEAEGSSILADQNKQTVAVEAVKVQPLNVKPEPTVAEKYKTSGTAKELVGNPNFTNWSKDGKLLRWTIRSGHMQRSTNNSGITMTPSADDVASLKTELAIPKDAGGRTILLSLTAKAPQDTIRVFLLQGGEQLGRLLPDTNEQEFSKRVARIKLPEGVESELTYLISADLPEGTEANLKTVSAKLLD